MMRNIIWDVDGTLFDTYPAMARAFQLGMKELGHDVLIEWIMAAARQSLGYCVTTLAAEFGLDENEIGNRFEQYYNLARPEDQPPFHGVINICQYICAQGGKNLIVSHRGNAGVTELLSIHQMESLFSGQITSDDGFPKKPNPAAFIAAFKRFSVDPAETITIGDRDNDILAGQAAGLFSCLFGDDKSKCVPDFLFSKFEEFYGFLLTHNNKGS